MEKIIPLEDRRDWLKIKEEIELIEKAKRGDNQAFGKLHSTHSKLIAEMANRFYYLGRETFLDLLQEGNLGLLKAIEMYDWRKGYKLAAYARWWIKHRIHRAVIEQRILPLNDLVYRRIGKLLTAEGRLLQKGKELTLEEISAESGMNLKLVKKLYRAMEGQKTVFLDQPPQDSDTRLEEILDLGENEESMVFNRVFAEEVMERLESLNIPQKYRIVFKLRVGRISLEEVKEEIDKLHLPECNKKILKLRVDLVKIIAELKAAQIKPKQIEKELDRLLSPQDNETTLKLQDLVEELRNLIKKIGRHKTRGEVFKKRGYTLDEIGKTFGLSRERINQIIELVGKRLKYLSK